MTEFLLKTFVKDHKNTESSAVRTKQGAFAGRVGIFCNIVLFIIKVAAGILSGSVAITADAFNNLSDASSSVISLVAFKLSEKPADADHPYGHARFEYLSGLIMSILVCVIGIELFKTCFGKIITPEKTTLSLVSGAILVISVLVKLWMMVFYKKVGKNINSQVLFAAAADSRNDALSTFTVLISAVFVRVTGIEIDGYVGAAVAIFIIVGGFGLIKDTLDPLLGKAPDSGLTAHIQDKILSYDSVLGTHDLIIHDYGPGRMFASVHVEMPAEEDVIKSHDIIDNIERYFAEKENLHLIVHFDPISTKDEKVNRIREWLCEKVKEIHPTLSIHDFRMVEGTTHTNLIFDCVVPHGIGMSEAEVREKIKAAVFAEEPTYYCIITIDADYASVPRD